MAPFKLALNPAFNSVRLCFHGDHVCLKLRIDWWSMVIQFSILSQASFVPSRDFCGKIKKLFKYKKTKQTQVEVHPIDTACQESPKMFTATSKHMDGGSAHRRWGPSAKQFRALVRLMQEEAPRGYFDLPTNNFANVENADQAENENEEDPALFRIR